MAPEQARGEKVDARADLFSFGCVLYRLCAGELPFKGQSTMAVLTSLATVDPPPPSSRNKEIPAGLSSLIEDLLKKDPAKRPRSARDVLHFFVEISKAPPAVPRPTRAEPPSKPAPPTVAPVPKPAPSPPAAATPKPVTARQPSPQQSLLDAIEQERFSPKTKPGPTTVPAKKPPAGKPPSVLAWVAAGLGGLAVVFGIVFFWPTPDGVVRFEIDDPAIKVSIDKNGPTITGADAKPISLKPGPHGLTITRDDFTFDTKSFQIKKADKAVLKIEWLPGKVQVLYNGTLLDVKDLSEIGVATRPTTPDQPTPPITASATTRPPSAEPHALFNGKDLDGWNGLSNVWSVKHGAIVGKTPPEGLKANTFLCTKRKYRDFELTCKVKVSPLKANSGIQIRSFIHRPDAFSMTGPQVDIGEGFWGCLYGENAGGMLKQADPAAVGTVKPLDFTITSSASASTSRSRSTAEPPWTPTSQPCLTTGPSACNSTRAPWVKLNFATSASAS